jgi:hypothetical protein
MPLGQPSRSLPVSSAAQAPSRASCGQARHRCPDRAGTAVTHRWAASGDSTLNHRGNRRASTYSTDSIPNDLIDCRSHGRRGTGAGRRAQRVRRRTASFNLTVGATCFKGTVDFYNRTADVDGVLRGLSTGCRRGAAWANDTAMRAIGLEGARLRRRHRTTDIPWAGGRLTSDVGSGGRDQPPFGVAPVGAPTLGPLGLEHPVCPVCSGSHTPLVSPYRLGCRGIAPHV